MTSVTLTDEEPSSTREWQIFAVKAFSKIIARKHGLAVPPVDLEKLSDEQLEARLRLISELAHLPSS